MMNKTKILVIFTGGTISMQTDISTSKTIMGQSTTNLKDILEDAFRAIEFKFIEHSLMPSPYITEHDMFKLAKLTDQMIATENYQGVVITHGTDTIEETAIFLDLYLDTQVPVVLTGSMRNLSELGYDGLSNLVSAVLVASYPGSKNRGVLLVMNDEINSALEVTKTHTVALDTFKSLEFGPLGIVDQHDVLYYREYIKTKQKIKITKLTKKVEIVKVYAGATDNMLNHLIDMKVDGIVLESLGRGNIPPTMVPGVIRAIKNEIPILLTSRCPKGRVLDTYAYEGGGDHLRRLGVLFAGNLNSQKARIKLMLALDKVDNLEQLSEYFEV